VTRRIRLVLLLHAAAIAAVLAAALLGAGLPLAAAGVLQPPAFTALAVLVSLLVLIAGAAILSRWVGRPLERMMAAARVLGGASPELPPLGLPGEEGEPGLSRAAVAFERLAAALAFERRGLAAKVEELEAANRKLAEARAELDRSERLATVGRLAAGIAHEVGNPLGAIGGYAELARDRALRGAPAAEVADFLERILAETRRIDAIVRDLLDFSRPSPDALAPVRLASALDAALRLARVQPRFRGVEVETELQDDLPSVVADERRLAQVFLNLFLNAGDAMEGTGKVRVAARAVEGGMEVLVADSGPGIPPENLPHVFEPFFTTKEPGEGTGLGLSVCHGIVSSFGGTIVAASGSGGARFLLRLRTR
jgi:C4-dicarboxylate-specific signal transduction histidine kinase